MDTPLSAGKCNTTRAAHHPQTPGAETVTAQNDIAETAQDADTLMRTIIGSLSLDPDDIERDLKKKAHQSPALPEKELNFRLVIFVVVLVFLVFALDLVFQRM
jgi:hypothetical protein